MDLELEPTETHRLIRDAARAFAEREIAPFARAWDRDERMEPAVLGKLAAAGYLGAVVPAEYGGAGFDMRAYCLVVEELGRADSSVRGVVTVNNGLVAKSILRFGTDEQRRRWLPRLADGTTLGCFGLTEPGTGSDAGNLETSATREGGGWRITGRKMFITNGTRAGLALIFARTGGPGPRGVSCFLVPTDAPGFRASEIRGKLGLRAQDTAELALEDVRVPADALLGAENEGFRVAMGALDGGRVALGAGCVGIARACLDAMLAYAGQREQFGRPIARFQLVQELIADTAVEVEAAALLVAKAAALADAGRTFRLEASMAKYFASETAVRAANAALQVHGGYGYVDEYPVGKLLRDARVTTLYEGTSQVQKLLIGRALTGENAFG